MLNKAFGYGSNIFKNKRGNRPAVSDFLKKEKMICLTSSLIQRSILDLYVQRQ